MHAMLMFHVAKLMVLCLCFFCLYIARGTGRRHAVLQWPTSSVTGRSHKLVIPAEAPDKKVLFVMNV